MQAANEVLVVASHIDPEHAAQYAIAFPEISRSIVTRARSARKRLISICSAVTFDRLSAPLSAPSRCALTQLKSVCSTSPNVLEAPRYSGPTQLAEPPPA